MAQLQEIKRETYLTLDEYQERAIAANQFKGAATAIDQLRFGLFGEIGGLLAAVKKAHRDFGPAEQASVQEELGDALWYLATVAAEYELSLQEVGREAMAAFQPRFNVSLPAHAGPLTFHEFDALHALVNHQLKAMSAGQQLLQLGSRAGAVMNSGTDLAAHPPVKLLGDLFADLVTVAALFHVTVTQAVHANLRKFESRWQPEGTPYVRLFDEGLPKIEQFPRKFDIHFIQRLTSDGKPYVLQQLWGVNIGDRLTDNRSEPDGYRFHDVFHLAYIVHLGWSPVMRALLRLKRKSNPDLDENQDGARAMIIEEGIATWIFNHAARRNYFEGVVPGRLEYGLLKQVVDMVEGYEVSECPMWQWETAILDGFRVFRALRDAGSGIVGVDLESRKLTFQPLDAETEVDPTPLAKRSIVMGSALPPQGAVTS